MALPTEFNPWEHLQNTLLQTYNKQVRDEFSDLTEEDDLTVSRSSLRVACRIRDDDSAIMVLNRMLLFYITVGKAADFQAPIYSNPLEEYGRNAKYKPQVCLYFKQDNSDVQQGRRAVESHIKFRLVGSRWETVTEAELLSLANDIKREFASSKGYRWSKGEILYTYDHQEHGMCLHVYSLNKQTAIDLIKKIYELVPFTYDNDYIVEHKSERNYPNTPGTVTILGKSRKTPVRRPTVYVRFQKASVDIYGLPVPIILVGFRYRHKNALVTWEPWS
jgi:hypothetical protein